MYNLFSFKLILKIRIFLFIKMIHNILSISNILFNLLIIEADKYSCFNMITTTILNNVRSFPNYNKYFQNLISQILH